MSTPTPITPTKHVKITDVVLIRGTRPQHEVATTLNYTEWGQQLTMKEYHHREDLLQDTGFTRQGHSSWLLVPVAEQHAEMPTILAACETFKRPCRVGDQDTFAWSVASVFTRPEFRGCGYATTMMSMLRDRLVKEHPKLGVSTLYSDIGPKYYDRLGWRLFPSDSVSSADLSAVSSTTANWIDDVTALDFLAESYAAIPQRAADGKQVVAVPLDAANYRWHHVRGVFYDLHTTAYALAVNVPDEIRRRAGASLDNRNYVIWTHAKHSKSTLYILHLEATSPENAAELLRAAAVHAKARGLTRVEAFASDGSALNDAAVLAQLGDKWMRAMRSGSLSSLMLWRDGKVVADPATEIVWYWNEKYAWV